MARPTTATPSDLMSSGDIAALLGVRASVVSNWRARHESFPKPWAVIADDHTPVWHRSEVLAWARTRFGSLLDALDQEGRP